MTFSPYEWRCMMNKAIESGSHNFIWYMLHIKPRLRHSIIKKPDTGVVLTLYYPHTDEPFYQRKMF